MSSCNQDEKVFSEKLALYFEANPNRLRDVAFAVGPQKEIIRTSRLMLEVACPEFMTLFDEKWGQSVVKDGEENSIPLLEVNPSAFKLFLKLLITDHISVDLLQSMKLEVEDLLGVTELCKKYKASCIQKKLEELAQETIFEKFASFTESEQFLGLSKVNFKTILSVNELCADEITVFRAALKWADFQCNKKGIESSGENVRGVLGDALFLIRFPTMNYEEFGSEVRLRDILTKDEQLDIFRYISLQEKDKVTYDSANFQFNTANRFISELITMRVADKIGYEVGNNPPFICNGDVKMNYFEVDHKIALHKIGFLGPINSNSYYDITVEIVSFNFKPAKPSTKIEKRVFAERSKVFYITFNEPIILEATCTTLQKNLTGKFYRLQVSVKGPPTSCFPKLGESVSRFVGETNGVGLYCQWYNNPVAEFRFRKC